MQGEDVNDSNCIDFSKINKIRDINKLTNSSKEVKLNGLRVGVIDEFDIEELDRRNNNVQKLILEELVSRGA